MSSPRPHISGAPVRFLVRSLNRAREAVVPRRGTPAARAVALIAAIAMTTTGIVALSIPMAAPAQATATSVALVGSLQDELGCSGDWQPECEATELTATGVPGRWAAVSRKR